MLLLDPSIFILGTYRAWQVSGESTEDDFNDGEQSFKSGVQFAGPTGQGETKITKTIDQRSWQPGHIPRFCREPCYCSIYLYYLETGS